MKIICIGLDLAKNFKDVFAIDQNERPVIRKTLKRNKVRQFFAQQALCVVVMESCCDSKRWEC